MTTLPITAGTALRLEGRDALAVLHRISTNALLELGPGQARATLFCDFRGRLLHRAIVALASDGAVWLLRDDASGDTLAALLDQSIFREDVRLADRSAELQVLISEGDETVAHGSLAERDGTPLAARPERGPVLLVAPPSAIPRSATTPEAALRARIEAGRPAHGHEIADEFTPYEVGLADEVHLDKGCYTGQEALQRLITHSSVRRRLARVGGQGSAPETPCDVTSAGERVGRLTSAVGFHDPEGRARWVGLAVLQHRVVDTVQPLEVAGAGPIGQPHAFPVIAPLGRP